MGITGQQMAAQAEIAYAEKWGYIWATAGEKWTENKQRELEAKYRSDPSKYADYAQGAAYGSKWIGQMVTDCSGLVKWAALKCGLKGIYHGSNSIFNRNCKKIMKIEKGSKIPIGAMIFTGKESGQHNHIGILTSTTCVTEAQGTSKGVVHTSLSNKKWTYWGLLKGVDYEESIPDEATIPIHTTVTLPTLRKGAKGSDVEFLQGLLVADDEKALPKYGIDGDFGNETLRAVKSYQKKHGLVVDGIVGPKTWTELTK